jgi:hypothetical protein
MADLSSLVGKKTITPTASEPPMVSLETLKKYAPMLVRGAAGFAPGGLIGAGIGGGGELLAQTLEGRPDYNWAQVGTQSAIGAVPFGKAATLARTMLKGGLMGGASSIATQQAEQGLHVPSVSDLESAGINTAVGAAGGALATKLHQKFGPPEKVNVPKEDVPKVNVPEKTPEVKTLPDGQVIRYATRKIITEGGKTPEKIAKEAEEAVKFEGIDKTIYKRAKRTIDAMEGKGASDKIDDPRKVIAAARKIDPTIPRPKAKPKVTIPTPEEPTVVPPTDTGTPTGTPNTPSPQGWFAKAKAIVPRKEDGTINWNDVINAPKATSASGDLSAALHQGIFLMGRESWRKSLIPMLKAVKKSNYEAQLAALEKDTSFGEAVTNGVKFSKVGEAASKGEEQFGSSLAERLPLGIGKYFIAPSERAYTSFLNHLRLGTYKNLVEAAEKLKDPTITNRAAIANYVNTASGRGNMSLTIGPGSETGEKAAQLLNNFFFSPRFIASRVQLLNPYTYYKLDPFLRKQAARDLATLTGVAATVLGSAHQAGAEVGMDPTSADFGKIKIGNTRVDALGGFGQYIRFASQIAKYAQSGGSEESKANLGKLVKSKLSPTARFADELVTGKDYFGRDTSVAKSVANTFTPLVAKDLIEAFKDDPKTAAMLAIPSIAGVPTQTYSNLGSSSGKRKSNRSGFKGPKIPTVKLP